MFWHIFHNRFKCLVRDRQLVFWTFLYPLVLATLFSLAFSNLSNHNSFRSIPIAIVNNAEFESNTAFKNILSTVSNLQNPKTKDKLFQITLSTKEQAENSLKNNEIKGYILFENGARVIVKESGVSQSILKEFMDSYLQTSSAYTTISRNNPAAMQAIQVVQTDTSGSQTYLQEVAPGKAVPNSTLIYFYALIAMATLFGGLWGKKEISDIQADLSPQGARLNLGPINKLKALGYSLSAAIVMQFLSLILLVAYLSLVLKVDFGGQILFVLLTCLAGSINGVSFGALIGAAIKKRESLKQAVLISVSLILSFLAGMMVPGIKYTVTHTVPILAYINPANLITDAFYALYYYSSHTRFFLNIGLLLGLSLLFYLVVFLITRRQKYASL